jgi:hypothetical protein
MAANYGSLFPRGKRYPLVKKEYGDITECARRTSSPNL